MELSNYARVDRLAASLSRDLANLATDSPEKFKGAPVSLQLVARGFEDEQLLSIAELIQEKIRTPFAYNQADCI